MKRLRIVLIALLAGGCASLQSFWDDEFLSKYRPDVLVDRQKNILAEGLNYQLGRSKSERIRVAGPPQECVTLETAGERCEWKSAWVATKSVSPDTQSRTTEAYQYFTFNYDRNGIANSWSYRGPYGQFTNTDYKQTKTQRASSSQPAPSLERE